MVSIHAFQVYKSAVLLQELFSSSDLSRSLSMVMLVKGAFLASPCGLLSTAMSSKASESSQVPFDCWGQ